jgi:hypothetical protein
LRESYSIPENVQKKPVYYLVDWDFREHKENRVACRKELLKVLGVKSLRGRESTTSVIPVETLKEALELYDIIVNYGAIVNLRECKPINPDSARSFVKRQTN